MPASALQTIEVIQQVLDCMLICKTKNRNRGESDGTIGLTIS